MTIIYYLIWGNKWTCVKFLEMFIIATSIVSSNKLDIILYENIKS